MAVGSSYSTLKAAMQSRLAARPALEHVNVRYQAPEKPEDHYGDTGLGEAIWFDYAHGDQDNVVICSLPLHIEEKYWLCVYVQVLKEDDTGTQQAADTRVDELLYELFKEMATDPTFGADAQFDYLHTTKARFDRQTGFLPNGAGHGAVAKLEFYVEGRLRFS